MLGDSCSSAGELVLLQRLATGSESSSNKQKFGQSLEGAAASKGILRVVLVGNVSTAACFKACRHQPGNHAMNAFQWLQAEEAHC